MFSITKIIKKVVNKKTIKAEEAKKRNIMVNNIIIQIKSLSNSNQIELITREGCYIRSSFDL